MLLQEKKSKSTLEKDKVQIIHSHGDHWIVAATIEATLYEVKVYDSIFDSVDDHTTVIITNLFGSLAKSKTAKIPKQSGASNCHLYTIANATALCFGKDLNYPAFKSSIDEASSSPVYGAENHYPFSTAMLTAPCNQ